MQYAVFDDMDCCTDEAVERLLPVVSASRREYALRYAHTFGRFCTLQSWLMLQPVLGDREWQKGPHGKPYVSGGPEFSLSHCKHAIAVAWGASPVGIDVESIRGVEQGLIDRTMNAAEQALIRASASPERAFIRLWTQKEAYLKYIGTGITDDLPNALVGADSSRFLTMEKDTYILSIYG